MPEQVIHIIPDINELKLIENQLDSANIFLDQFENSLDTLDDFFIRYSQIESITRKFSKGDISVITEYLGNTNLPIIQKFTGVVEQIKSDIENLEERIKDIIIFADDSIDEFNDKVDQIKSHIETVGECAEILNETLDNILINKSESIKEAIEALTQLRQDKLIEGSSWVKEQVQIIVDKLIENLLDNITPDFESYTKEYIRVIDEADQHVENISRNIEDTIGKINEPLNEGRKIINEIEPVLVIVEKVLA